MFAHERILYGYLYAYAHKLVADIPAEHFIALPAPGMNSPAWLIGHLAVAADYGLEVLGKPYTAPALFHDLYCPGTEPTEDRSKYPPKDELLAAYDAGHAAMADAVPDADPARMAMPNDLGFLPELPTIGAVVAHLLTTHEAIHLGQLSAWRRAVGLSGV